MRKSIQQELGNINIVDPMANRFEFVEQCRFKRALESLKDGEKASEPGAAPVALFRSIVNSEDDIIPVINRTRWSTTTKSIAHAFCMAMSWMNKRTLVFGYGDLCPDGYDNIINEACLSSINFGVRVEGDDRQMIAEVFDEALKGLDVEDYPTVVVYNASTIPNKHFGKIKKHAGEKGLRLVLLADNPLSSTFEDSSFAQVYYESPAVDEDIRSALRGSHINFDRVVKMRSTAAILGGPEKLEAASENIDAFKNIIMSRRDRQDYYKPEYKLNVSVPGKSSNIKDEIESLIQRIEALEFENRILSNANLIYTITRAPERRIEPDQSDEK